MTNTSFSTELPILLYARPAGEKGADWQEIDQGPGFFHLAEDTEYTVRIRNIGDEELEQLVHDLQGCLSVIALNLSENRKITNEGLPVLSKMPHLTWLNLSACGITDTGLAHLAPLQYLTHLDLSFCNRLTDLGLKHLKRLRNLNFVDLQGCAKIIHGGVARINKRGLTIHEAGGQTTH